MDKESKGARLEPGICARCGLRLEGAHQFRHTAGARRSARSELFRRRPAIQGRWGQLTPPAAA